MKLNNGITKTTKGLLIAGQVGCILFIVLFLIQGQLREGYSPLKFPVSSLSIGQYGWIQQANFLISGALIFLSSFGLYKATTNIKGQLWTSIFFGVAGLGLIGAGIFTSDPVYGYPLTEPFHGAQYTVTGRVHEAVSTLFFVGVPVTCFKMRYRFKAIGEQRLALLSNIFGFGILAGLVISGAGFRQTPYLVIIAGLLQRLTIILALSWLTFLLKTIIKNSAIKHNGRSATIIDFNINGIVKDDHAKPKEHH
jgi:hypothetical protein